MARDAQFVGESVEFQALYQFTALHVSHGRSYAKEGHKDYARDILRFVRNARIVPILLKHGFAGTQVLADLQSNLSLLSGECHPLDVPNFKTDLQAIRSSLENLEHLINESRPLMPELEKISCGADRTAANLVAGSSVPFTRGGADYKKSVEIKAN